MIGTLFYSMQLYCDFAGYSNIVVGGAKLMGINLTHNFNAPYLSETISEFWRRWHISLSSWFRDYVYIPLGGNRKGTVRKLINIIIVFILCGLWHGAAWTFVVLGLLHGLFQVFGDVLGPVRDKGAQILRIRRNGFSHRLLKKVITFTLVNLSWVFFRSPSIDEALYIITHMWQITPWVITQGELFTLGLERIDVMLVLYALALQIGVDIFNHKGIQLRHVITRQSLPLRWLIYIVAVVFVLTCGIWGPGSASVPFIYSGF
jgi:D-alanyl-lipoteichoic acid acyltransferase DltB (MBOAT superfamily)